MSIKLRIKRRLFERVLRKRSKTHPFDPDYAENYQTPDGADKFHNNSYYFSAHDIAGNSLLFRHGYRGTELVEAWFAYRDADGNAYINEKQFFENEEPSTGVELVEAAKTWKFSFAGSLKNIHTDETIEAKFEGTFEATAEIFDFGTGLDPRIMAKGIANEKWSRAFFSTLQENNQVHTEQPGKVTGTLELDGKKTKIDSPAMRDHSFGKRDWNYMNRHFWLMALFEDGSHLNANAVSYPAVNLLQTGYMQKDGEVMCVEDAEIIGEMKPYEVPKKFTYTAKLADGTPVRVTCEEQDTFVFPFDNGNYTIYEGVGTFEKDGLKGRGVLEFGFNKDASRL